MFLVRGEIYHEDVWTEWIGNLADIVPASIVCDEDVAHCFRGMLQRNAPIKSIYDRQIYYSIVVHTEPDYSGYNSGSIFDGRIVLERVEVCELHLDLQILPKCRTEYPRVSISMSIQLSYVV